MGPVLGGSGASRDEVSYLGRLLGVNRGILQRPGSTVLDLFRAVAMVTCDLITNRSLRPIAEAERSVAIADR